MRKYYKAIIGNKVRYFNNPDYVLNLLESNKITEEEYLSHKLYVLNPEGTNYDLSTEVFPDFNPEYDTLSDEEYYAN